MIELAQVAEATETVFGLSVAEWSVLLTALAGFLAAVRENLAKRRANNKVMAVVDAIEETAELHPEAVAVVKRMAKAKASSMGVQVSTMGFEGLDVFADRAEDRNTQRLKKKITPPEGTQL